MGAPSPTNPSFSIASGQTASSELDLFATTLAGIIMPAAFTGATVSFQVAPLAANGVSGTYVPLYDSTNALVSYTVAASRAYIFNPANFAGWRFIKIVSASAEGADRVILAATRHMQ